MLPFSTAVFLLAIDAAPAMCIEMRDFASIRAYPEHGLDH